MKATTATELRCSRCLMPTEVTDNVVIVHDAPYATDHYGRCDGSGKPALTGPATPPTAWGHLEGKTYVDIGVLPSPMPTVKRDGWTVTISGVRFTHSTHCWNCRVVVTVATDGGTIQLGFDHKGRSFEKERPGDRATYDGPCPNGCNGRVVIGGRYSHPTPGLPVAEGRTVQFREWQRLRGDLKVWTTHMTSADMRRLRKSS